MRKPDVISAMPLGFAPLRYDNAPAARGAKIIPALGNANCGFIATVSRRTLARSLQRLRKPCAVASIYPKLSAWGAVCVPLRTGERRDGDEIGTLADADCTAGPVERGARGRSFGGEWQPPEMVSRNIRSA